MQLFVNEDLLNVSEQVFGTFHRRACLGEVVG